MAYLRKRTRFDGSISYNVVHRDPVTGKQLSVNVNSEAEANQLLLVMTATHNIQSAQNSIGAARRQQPVLRAVVLEHLETRTNVSAAQLKRYRNQVRDYLSEDLGYMPIDEVSLKDVSRWVQRLKAKNLKPKTIHNVHGLLSSAMKTAVILQYRKSNPCDGVRLPKSESTEDDMCLLTKKDLALISAAMSQAYQPFIRFLVGTGARWGEATALQISDLDLDAATPTIRIVRAWKRDDNNAFYIGTTKTSRSRRTVSLGEDVVALLRKITVGRPMTDLVFLNARQLPIKQATFWETHWKLALTRAQNPVIPEGIDPSAIPRLTKNPRIHDLRHTHASWMIAAGADLFIVQHRLGHESITTTTDRYSHLMPEQHPAAGQTATQIGKDW